MTQGIQNDALVENLRLELRRGSLVLAVLVQLRTEHYGYTLRKALAHYGMDIDEGTLYPLLLKLEHEGSIASEWGASENNRRARFYRLTASGRRQLQEEAREWEQTAAIIGRFFKVRAEDLT